MTQLLDDDMSSGAGSLTLQELQIAGVVLTFSFLFFWGGRLVKFTVFQRF